MDGSREPLTSVKETHVTPAPLRPFVIAACLATFGFQPIGTVLAESSAVQFDMPPLTVAVPYQPTHEFQKSADLLPGETLVACELVLSSMIEEPRKPRVEQWVVRCQPRDESVKIADYGPRTEVASEVDGPIQVKQLDEHTESFGMSVDGAHGHLARASFGTDHGQKRSDTYQFNKIAPLQTVIASGTINRGRGVYFKLRSAATQVLEGEKTFTLMVRVPENWRSGLIDVSVSAQTQQRSLVVWDDGVKTVGSANFVVAAYRQGDREAARAAQTLADAEQKLRRAAEQTWQRSGKGVAAMLRRVVTTLDVTKLDRPPELDASPWVDRLITGEADPYFDQQVRRLPVDVRVAALDYCDARDTFASLQ